LTAVATRVTSLETTVNDGTTGLVATRARLITEETTRATADTALSSRTTTLEATVNTGPNANATIRSDLTVAAGVGTANASAITTLNTTVGSHSASITSFASSIGGLQAKVGVRIDVNGRITGWELNNSGSSDSCRFTSSNFSIYDPTLGDTPVFQVIGGRIYGNFYQPTALIPTFTTDVNALIAAAPPGPAIISVAVSGTITFTLDPGASRYFEGKLAAVVTGGTGSVSCKLQIQVGSGAFSDFTSLVSASGSTSDPIEAVSNGSTPVNTSGIVQIYTVRAVVTISGAASNAGASYLKG
jgi:hypothetical protein